jgi:DNA-binding transcriptional LysR family regulator
MELRHLKYFVTVAEERHFTRAAERLGMAQPPISQQIHKLEREIGAQLFRRLTRGVELTDAGRVLYEDAVQILRLVEQAQSRAQSAARGQTGHIRVGLASSVVFHPVISELMVAYRASHPQVSISPSESNISALMEDLLEERIDVAIIRQTSLATDRIKLERVLEEHMLVVLSSQHVLAEADSVRLDALAGERFIMFPRSIAPVLYDDVISACKRCGFSPQLAQESTQVASAVSMVAAGFGVTVVPNSIRDVHPRGVTYHEIEGVQPTARVLLAWRCDEFSRAVRDFVDEARRAGKRYRSANAPGVAA